MKTTLNIGAMRSSISKAPKTRRRKSLRCLNAQRGNLADILLAFGVPGVVRGLHADPDAGAVAEQFAEPNRHGSKHRFALAQNVVEMLAGDAEKLRDLGFGPADRANSSPFAGRRLDASPFQNGSALGTLA